MLFSKFPPFQSHAHFGNIIYLECGWLNIDHGKISAISEDGTVVTVTCEYGSTFGKITVECVNGTWSYTELCNIEGKSSMYILCVFVFILVNTQVFSTTQYNRATEDQA